MFQNGTTVRAHSTSTLDRKTDDPSDTQIDIVSQVMNSYQKRKCTLRLRVNPISENACYEEFAYL